MNLVWEFLIACQLIADAVHYCGVMNSKWFKGLKYGNEASDRTLDASALDVSFSLCRMNECV